MVEANLHSVPREPLLEMSEIQGAVLPGFFKPHQMLIGLRIPKGPRAVGSFKALLKSMARDISTAALTLADRRAFRQRRKERKTPHPLGKEGTVLVGLALSSSCLLRLVPSSGLIPSEAFHSGMVKRSALLGDSTDPNNEGYPENWFVGKPGFELDALIIIAGDHRHAVSDRAHALHAALEAAGADVLYREEGNVLPGKQRGHEHFGFDDGVSQPGIRGISDATGEYITERHIDPAEIPEALLYGYPGQDLVWPGEFVLGYPRSGPDPLLPGLPDPLLPLWTRNGSFLVFRRLRQDVPLFWQTMRRKAEGLAKLPGFTHMDQRRLASLLVGRWPSGAPVNRSPGEDNPAPMANNNFIFDSDTPSLKLKGGGTAPYPSLSAKADPVGATCPWAAHIRKLNTRDSASDMGGRESTFNRRLLRVGIPFGESLYKPEFDPEALNGEMDKWLKKEDPEKGNRGLLFLSIQASIEDQFEFLMSRWVNDAARPKLPGGNDMLIGQNAAGGIRKCALFGSGQELQEIQTDRQWVIPTGGGYFFMPSISALRDVIAE
jgi:Dyp-type peroxidase family